MTKPTALVTPPRVMRVSVTETPDGRFMVAKERDGQSFARVIWSGEELDELGERIREARAGKAGTGNETGGGR